MTTDTAQQQSRGRDWFTRLTGAAGTTRLGSVLSAEGRLGDETVQFIAVVPDPQGRFPRAHAGETGLEEGWTLAAEVDKVIAADADRDVKRPIVAVVDVPSQAYGHREELVGIHQALAASAGAYAAARLAGHPVVAFIVGKAISGAFLAHGLQANRLVALDDDAVQVQVMGKEAAARITRRTLAEMAEAAKSVPATAYDVRSFATLGALHRLLPGDTDLEQAREVLVETVADARSGPRDLSSRLASPEARQARAASAEVRSRLAAAWEA
ncbi:biotin-independent malonate decarboxylase subunit gamma [Streptomyces sp. J2-1]|uniref:biotin-independent malonate decarboxylase subunit gamma n=1 Tax=Streptomyces corallincola TaxID=2851888 RepID=UPI001C394D3E|nr:biotin-independent malonate decarboxylase subunit gamma [Streptomyces corallincola]MBV2353878.1 biotin-independent malonate decarboxylase subunit gamma [Streptomyces corallincola]